MCRYRQIHLVWFHWSRLRFDDIFLCGIFRFNPISKAEKPPKPKKEINGTAQREMWNQNENEKDKNTERQKNQQRQIQHTTEIKTMNFFVFFWKNRKECLKSEHIKRVHVLCVCPKITHNYPEIWIMNEFFVRFVFFFRPLIAPFIVSLHIYWYLER